MNYIQLINQFWHCNKEHSFTPNETAVYFGILDTCNELLWKNPFNQSNSRLANKCNVSEPTFIKARNALKQRGLIEFTSTVGRRNNTVYEIKYLKSFSISDSVSDSINGDISDRVLDENRFDNNKPKTETKQKEVVLPFPSDLFKAKWKEYKDWKKAEKKGGFKSVQGEQAALSHLAEISTGDETIAIRIINKGMANSWQGLFPLDTKELAPSNQNNELWRNL